MKRNLFLLILTVLMTSTLMAQPRPRPNFQGGPDGPDQLGPDAISLRDRCCPVIPPRRVLVRVLQLDEDQLAKVAELHQAIAEAVGPLREELKLLGEALRAELGSEDPDPCEVGQLLLAIKELQAEICETLRSFDAEFEAILSPEQLERWLTIKARFCNRDGRPRPDRVRPDEEDLN